MTGVLTVRKTQSNNDDDELVLSLTSTCLVVGEGKKIHRRRTRRRAAENLLQNQMVFVTKRLTIRILKHEKAENQCVFAKPKGLCENWFSQFWQKYLPLSNCSTNHIEL